MTTSTRRRLGALATLLVIINCAGGAADGGDGNSGCRQGNCVEDPRPCHGPIDPTPPYFSPRGAPVEVAVAAARNARFSCSAELACDAVAVSCAAPCDSADCEPPFLVDVACSTGTVESVIVQDGKIDSLITNIDLSYAPDGTLDGLTRSDVLDGEALGPTARFDLEAMPDGTQRISKALTGQDGTLGCVVDVYDFDVDGELVAFWSEDRCTITSTPVSRCATNSNGEVVTIERDENGDGTVDVTYAFIYGETPDEGHGVVGATVCSPPSECVDVLISGCCTDDSICEGWFELPWQS